MGRPRPKVGDIQSPVSAHYEKQAVTGASLVVMNTALAEQMMRQRYPEMAESIICCFPRNSVKIPKY